MESMFSDARIAIRNLLKRPGFLAVTVSRLRSGLAPIRRFTASFTACSWHPLGFDDEDRLVAVSSVNPAEGLELRGNFVPDFWFWRENSRAFDEIAFHG